MPRVEHTWTEDLDRRGRRFSVDVTAVVAAVPGRTLTAELQRAVDADGYDWAPSLSSMEDQVLRARAIFFAAADLSEGL